MAMDTTIRVRKKKVGNFFSEIMSHFSIVVSFPPSPQPLVEVTIRGAVDRKTGMVMNITELKEHMDQAIMKPLDHKNLDKDVDFFKVQVCVAVLPLCHSLKIQMFIFPLCFVIRFVQKPSTTENLAVFIWQNLTKRMHRPDLLYEVKIQETDKNSVVFRGRTTSSHSNNADRVRSSVSSDSDWVKEEDANNNKRPKTFYWASTTCTFQLSFSLIDATRHSISRVNFIGLIFI